VVAEESIDWRSVEPAEEGAWFEAMARIDAAPHANVACPSCRRADLRWFYLRHASTTPSLKRGGFWIWCPNCARFMHTSGSGPEWWQDVPEVDARDLTPEPAWLQRHWDVLSATGSRRPE
jgi:hypothetical protein